MESKEIHIPILNMKDVEDMILHMAEIVYEVRYLRAQNEELTLRNRHLEQTLNGMYKSSSENMGKLFSAYIQKTLNDIDELNSH